MDVRNLLLTIAVLMVFVTVSALPQTDVVKDDGITSELHRTNLGKIVFVPKAADPLTEATFIKSIEVNESSDLAIKAFLKTSLTNYLGHLAPEASAKELVDNGSYQVSFLVDGVLIHRENVNPFAISGDDKKTKTIFSATFLNSANKDSHWGTLWHIFMLNGGHGALTAGKHVLRIELRPYLTVGGQPKVGELVAQGELPLAITKAALDEKAIAVQPIQAGSGWPVSTEPFSQAPILDLNRKVAEKVYKDVTSVVVIKDGKLLIEEYFNGADRTTLHNTRSVGKSFASTMMGIAIGDGHIKSENQPLKDFYDLRSFANYSPGKETVTLKSLLTMSSAFNGNDDDEDSPGNEEKMYPTSNYVKFALDVPMDGPGVGQKWRYFTAGVVVLGDVINKSVPGGLEKYTDQKLFQPLGITKYQWQYTPQKVPLTAGGLQMSSLDFAKYGQLYKNGGRWNGKQVIPADWVNKTFTKHVNVPYGPQVFYGYLFWNTTYKVGDKSFEAFFATGNGGNKIFIFKDQPLVVVITATAFGKWYMHRQADQIMERHILPAVFNR